MISALNTRQQDHKLLSDFYRKQWSNAVSSDANRTYRLGLGVLQDFNKLRMATQIKNIAAWTPVVAEILQGFNRFDDKAVSPFPLLLLKRSLTSRSVREIPTGNLSFGN